MLAAWRAGGEDVIAASYGGVRGHPVLLARSAWADVPDEGARALDPELVPCDDLGHPGDVDYPRGSRGLGEAGRSATSFAFSSGDISSRHAVFT